VPYPSVESEAFDVAACVFERESPASFVLDGAF
jgi:hypothetical protein